MATTRRALRLQLGGVGFCNDTVVNSAFGASDSTKLVDTKLKQTDGAFNYGQVVMVTGSAAGDRRRITNWTQSTGTLTPDRNFTAAVSSGDTYEIHRVFAADDKDDAISEAIRESDRRFCRIIEDTSVSLSTNTWGYSISSLAIPIDRLHGIDRVEYALGGSGTLPPFQTLKPDWWNIRDNNGVLTLQLGRLPQSIQLPCVARLTYRVRPSTLTSDTSALDPDDTAFVEYICMTAAGLLFNRKAQLGDEREGEANEEEAMEFQTRAERWLQPTGALPIMSPVKKK